MSSATSTTETSNDLTMDLIMANNNQSVDTDIQHCIHHITNILHSVLTGDVNAHSHFWHPYTDEPIVQLIADVISNSDHITLNTPVSNTLYNRTSWATQRAPTHHHDNRLQQNIEHLQTTRKPTGHNLPKTYSPLSLRPQCPPRYTLPI